VAGGDISERDSHGVFIVCCSARAFQFDVFTLSTNNSNDDEPVNFFLFASLISNSVSQIELEN